MNIFTKFFLLFCSGAPRRRGWLRHVVRRRVVIWLSEFRTTFPIKGSYSLAIWCRIDGMRQKRIRMESFVMCSSMTFAIDMPSILRILWWKNTSNFLSSVSRSAQISHPHSVRLAVMAQKIRYLLWILTALSA